MEVLIGERVFQFPHLCPADALIKQQLTRHLRDHGPKSPLGQQDAIAICRLAHQATGLPGPKIR